MVDVRLSDRAYGKIILHCAKYPHCAINGVLLTKSANVKDNSKSKILDIVDAVPLFHICLNVTPMAEVALTQIDHWASNNGLIIAGYYTASDCLRENSIEKSNSKIGYKIADNFSSACLVVVDNSKLSQYSQTQEIPFKVCQLSNEGKWKLVDKVSMYPSNSNHAILSLVRVSAYESLVDFDNHLDNVSLDWKNIKINNEIDEVMKMYID